MLFCSVGKSLIFSVLVFILGRVTITDTWQNLPQAMTGKKPPKTHWSHTKQQVTLP
jgi:hypothetical protein